jgi:hypothetical protein
MSADNPFTTSIEEMYRTSAKVKVNNFFFRVWWWLAQSGWQR